jgi:hypothetical protein
MDTETAKRTLAAAEAATGGGGGGGGSCPTSMMMAGAPSTTALAVPEVRVAVAECELLTATTANTDTTTSAPTLDKPTHNDDTGIQRRLHTCALRMLKKTPNPPTPFF